MSASISVPGVVEACSYFASSMFEKYGNSSTSTVFMLISSEGASTASLDSRSGTCCTPTVSGSDSSAAVTL